MSTLSSYLWDLRCRLDLRKRVTFHAAKARSLAMRARKIQGYLASAPVRKVQIGCGPHRLAGWLNTDLEAATEVIYVDATRRLPFPEESVDFLFSEHMFEHITFAQGGRFLREAHRVLRPGGKLRIATPNLAFLVRVHREPDDELVQRYIRFSVDRFAPEPKHYSPGVVLNTFFYSWHHRFIYDEETLACTVKESGFRDLAFHKPGESADPELRDLEAHWRIIGHEFNNLETLVVEAAK